jgi:hypothetical protein
MRREVPGNFETPGHITSLGVPSVRNILNSSSISESPTQQLIYIKQPHAFFSNPSLLPCHPYPTWKQWSLHNHFCKYAADGPNIHRRGVVARAQEDLGRTVPQGNDLVRVLTQRNAECARKAEICELQCSLSVYEQVLGLQVSVEHSVGVTVGYPS